MVTIKDMAEMAGVAPTTVSNVLHGSPAVSLSTAAWTSSSEEQNGI
ncbi:MAG: LacI family DNA-binding transcriptional regulator [Clostridiaceae bacterium]|nr:LacI family DNA-binding transcriptional regulator [Clostridiaceae bacterium]